MKNYQAIIKRNVEIPYAALRRTVTQQEIPNKIPPLIGIVTNLLHAGNIKIKGDCFFRYPIMHNRGTNGCRSRLSY